MGVLTDLILATEIELAALPEDETPINMFPGIDIKGVGIIELATLHALLTGIDFDAAINAFPMVRGEESDEGPWINRLPDEFIRTPCGARRSSRRAGCLSLGTNRRAQPVGHRRRAPTPH
jgi:hypothetical protein